MEPEKYRKEIEKAISKYALYRTEDEKNDLRQECRLALIQAWDSITGKGYAYTVARNRVIRWLQRFGEKTLSTDNPAVLAAVEEQTAVLADPSDRIDAETLNQLPIMEATVLRLFFGIGYAKEYTLKEIAKVVKKPVAFVRTTKARALGKLKLLWKGKQNGRNR